MFDFGPFKIAGSPGTPDSPVTYAPRRTVLDKILIDAAAAAGVGLDAVHRLAGGVHGVHDAIEATPHEIAEHRVPNAGLVATRVLYGDSPYGAVATVDSLPRVTREILPASTQCPCCSREMARIGQDESKQLHLVPAHAEVHVTVRPKFACRACGELAQAPAPDDRPIERGLPTAGTIAQVVIAKYLNHMPLHRQAAHYARLGVLLATTTLYG